MSKDTIKISDDNFSIHVDKSKKTVWITAPRKFKGRDLKKFMDYAEENEPEGLPLDNPDDYTFFLSTKITN